MQVHIRTHCILYVCVYVCIHCTVHVCTCVTVHTNVSSVYQVHTHTSYCGHSNLILLPALSDGSITVLPPEEIFSPSDTEGSLLHVPKPRRGRAQPRERPQSFYGRSSPRQHKETSVWKGAITNLTHARGESVYARLFVVCARVGCAVLYLMNGGTNGATSHLVVFAVVLVVVAVLALQQLSWVVAVLALQWLSWVVRDTVCGNI